MKKGRHRRFEEARALKRSQDVDLDVLFSSLSTDDSLTKPEHSAWADEFDDDELLDGEDDDDEDDDDD